LAPLIVTLMLDPASQEGFDALRREHFPVERNHLAAHVTVFHHLPGSELEVVAAGLRLAASRTAFEVAVTGVRFLGRGVAYTLASEDLSRLRAALAERWARWLTPQDRQPYAPHVTVQNKVAPERARVLHGHLSASFTPYPGRAEGLALWHYEGGPWRHAAHYLFEG